MLEVTIPALVLTLMAIVVRNMVAKNAIPVTNAALLTLDMLVLLFSSTLLSSAESRTTVRDICRWAASKPVTRGELRLFLLLTGTFRAALYAAVLCSGAIGALFAPQDWWARVEIVLSAILFPVIPIAAALILGSRRPVQVSPRLVSVPLSLIFLGTALRLPDMPGVAGHVVTAIAAPALTLVGRAAPAVGVTVVLGELSCALWLLGSLSRMFVAAEPSVAPKGARYLARSGHRGLVRDLVTYQLTGRSVLVLVPPVLLLAATAGFAAGSISVAGQASLASGVLLGMLSWPVVSLGYQQTAQAVALPAAALRWLRSTPVSERSLAWAGHVACLGGAVAVTMIFAAIEVLLRLAGDPVPPLGIAAVALAPLALGGWIGVALRTRGFARLAGFVLLGLYVAMRALTVGIASVIHLPPAVLAGYLASDIAIGSVGHAVARLTVRKVS